MLSGNPVNGHEADVMPVMRILRARIANTDPEFHGRLLDGAQSGRQIGQRRHRHHDAAPFVPRVDAGMGGHDLVERAGAVNQRGIGSGAGLVCQKDKVGQSLWSGSRLDLVSVLARPQATP